MGKLGEDSWVYQNQFSRSFLSYEVKVAELQTGRILPSADQICNISIHGTEFHLKMLVFKRCFFENHYIVLNEIA